jgi:hypothetical protein
VGAGQSLDIEPTQLSRVDYAVLVRKGAGHRGFAHSVQLGPSVRSPLPSSPDGCLGGTLGYRIDLNNLGVVGRLGFCTGGFENSVLKARTNEYEFNIGADHTWDFSILSFFAGAGVGPRLVHQSFETRGAAPSKYGLSGAAFIALGATVPLSRRLYLGLEARGEGYLYRFQESSLKAVELRLSPALRGIGFLGYHL